MRTARFSGRLPSMHAPLPFATHTLPPAVADPGFPRGGGANSLGGRQHTILPYFPKNCMKLKEFEPLGGRASLAPPLRSATALLCMPPFTMHAPPALHTPSATHAPCHACPLHHAHPLHHTPPPLPHTPPFTTHTPLCHAYPLGHTCPALAKHL